MNMDRLLSFLLAGCAVCAFVSCGNGKKNNDIIAKKPIIVRSNKVVKMGDYSQSRKVEWQGAEYTISVTLTADTSLPIVKDGTQKYYDNKIELRVSRPEGGDLFKRTFTKADFAPYIGNEFSDDGALLGIVYDHTAGDCLYFAASVGSPDKSSDEYLPLVVKLTKVGVISISKDTQLDTSGDMRQDEGYTEI